MTLSKKHRAMVVRLTAICGALTSMPISQVLSQQPMPGQDNQVTMSIFPVQRGADGQQYIITRAGYNVNVPGLGIAPNATEISVYHDAKDDYWYVDRNGAIQPVSHQQLQWTMNQIMQQQQARMAQSGMPMQSGYANQSQPASSQPIVIQNQQPASGSSGSSAAVTGLAAAGGAMAGAAIGNSMYNNNSSWGVPYGAPISNQGGHYYYQGANNAVNEFKPPANNPYYSQYSQQAQAYAANPQTYQNAYHNAYPQQSGQYPNGQMSQPQSQYHGNPAASQAESQYHGNPAASQGEGNKPYGQPPGGQAQNRPAGEEQAQSEEKRRGRFGRNKTGENGEAARSEEGSERKRFGRGGGEGEAGRGAEEGGRGGRLRRER